MMVSGSQSHVVVALREPKFQTYEGKLFHFHHLVPSAKRPIMGDLLSLSYKEASNPNTQISSRAVSHLPFPF